MTCECRRFQEDSGVSMDSVSSPRFRRDVDCRVISNIGTWMSSAASSWLMTNLDADPLVVSLVQVAASLPMCMSATPAGVLADIGGDAVCGALVLRRLKSKFGPNALTAIGALGTALALTLFGLAREPLIGVAASAIAGVSWIAVLATLNVSAQVALPDWVRGRGLAMFVMVFFGAMTLGSAIWGEIAVIIGVPGAHFLAATGALLGIVLSWRCKLQDGAEVDLTPSMHWPTPVVSLEMQDDQGPVLVTVEYWIEATNRAAFLAAIEKLGHVRRRDGVYAWDIFEDAAEEGRYLETFHVESWLEHRRQHDWVTNADRTLQDAVDRFHMRGEPRITHFVSALRKQ